MTESPEARLAALGLELPAVPAPLAAYVPAVRTGRHVYTACQARLRTSYSNGEGVGGLPQRIGVHPALDR